MGKDIRFARLRLRTFVLATTALFSLVSADLAAGATGPTETEKYFPLYGVEVVGAEPVPLRSPNCADQAGGCDKNIYHSEAVKQGAFLVAEQRVGPYVQALDLTRTGQGWWLIPANRLKRVSSAKTSLTDWTGRWIRGPGAINIKTDGHGLKISIEDVAVVHARPNGNVVMIDDGANCQGRMSLFRDWLVVQLVQSCGVFQNSFYRAGTQ